MTGPDNDDAIEVIDALRSELKGVRLSPDFTARLRQRIEAEPARVGWRNGWRWLVPAMAAAAVITAAIVMRQPRTNEPVRVSRVSEATRPIAATPPVAPKPGEKAVVRRNPGVSQ